MQLYQDLCNHHPKQTPKNLLRCNVPGAAIVSPKTTALKLYSLFAFCLLATISFSSCKKDKYSTEEALYGTWVNRNAPGDTLVFMKKNQQHILVMNNSFNPSLPIKTEVGYTFKNDKLSVNTSVVSSAPLREISSFTWLEKGKTFEIKGFQLYLFMSSSLTKFVYVKVKD
jgi:hypothetical protein